MKKLLLLFLLSLTFGVGQLAAQSVFFSEYAEGGGNNKAIEIYNGTGATIDMSDYTIEKHTSASTTVSNTYTPGAVMVASGDVYVLVNNSANADFKATADELTTSQVMTYNGDDAVVLKKAGVIIDIIGTIDGNDPGSRWGVTPIDTQNNTIRRLSTISAGDVDGFTGVGTTSPGDISSEWEGFAQDTFNGFGTHTVATTSVPQLLITEIVITPTEGEFIEIYNPTGAAVDLTDVYLTDATFAGGGAYYYNITTGANYGGGGFGDFHARFPNGASIAVGEYQTVSLAGSDDFFATFGVNPTYELFEDAGAADAIPDMLEAVAGSISNQGGLTNSGEFAVLYHWDGASDLVTDLDYTMWGDKAEAVDKTAISIDGPDGDVITSPYLNDTPIANQEFIATHTNGFSMQRKDLAEGTETKIGGNGAGGHDETSENLATTWDGTTVATPNAAYAAPVVVIPFIINEVDADTPSGPDTQEFVEIFDGGAGNSPLDGYSIVLFNGSNDQSYAAFDLDGLTTDANGYFLLAGQNVAGIGARVTANTGIQSADDLIQNGADAVTLFKDDAASFPNGTAITTASMIDALVYDTNDSDDAGLLVLITSGSQINEDGNGDKDTHSAQRIPNGSGGERNTNTYDLTVATPGTANGFPVIPGVVPTNLLLSEIVTTPTASEYIEIFNPTSASIDLSDVYLTDATFSGGAGSYYYKLPTGANAGGGGFGDFHARFPNGATIAAGEYQTIGLNGAADFNTAYGQKPTYELYGSDATVPNMLEAFGGSIPSPTDGAGLSGGEVAVLYYWDGATDLVSDLDYALWGDKQEFVDKTGVSIDGPDALGVTTAYKADGDRTSQAVISTDEHASGKSYQRVDNSEGTETKTGGNGVQGHNEMSENLGTTWVDGGEPTPNAGYEPFVINEVDADTPGTDQAEFIEIFDGGVGNLPLDGYSIVLFNGSDDASYNDAFDLDGFTTDANGYFLLAGRDVAGIDARVTAQTGIKLVDNSIQNGADVATLVKDDAVNYPNDTPVATAIPNLIDALVYDTNDSDDAGLLVLLNAGQPQINEDAKGNKDNESLQRIPNGAGGLRNTNTYTQLVPTPGTANFAITTIAAARALPDGTVGVTVEGSLTVAGELGASAYVQDATGGIALFNGTTFDWSVYNIGDKLRISGDRGSFNGQKQLVNLTIVNLNTSTLIVPQVINLTQVDAHRGELVKIEAVHFPGAGDPFWSNSTAPITSGADASNVFISSAVTDLTNKSQPEMCDVIGVMGNFNGNSQLIPRSLADLPCANPLVANPVTFDANTLDVVAWNIEHFGAAGLGPADDALQVIKARDVILALDADVYALVEITNDNLFINSLLPQLPGYAVEVSPYTSGGGGAQKLLFLYKTSVVTKVSAQGLNINAVANGDVTDAIYPTGNKNQLWASGRFPYMMTADVNVNGSKERVNFVVLHAKAFNDNINFQRREFDAKTLHDSLSFYMPNEKIIIMGDHNDDMDVSISIPDPSPYNVFLNDVANYSYPTKGLSLSGKRTTVGFDNVIDHIGITNELFSAYMPNSENVHYEFYINDPTYDDTTSDHFPVSTRFAFPEISINTGTAVVVANNGNLDLGNTPTGTNLTQTVTISNDGLSDLLVSSVTLSSGSFSFSTPLAPNTTILAGQMATFDVEMDATITGAKSGMIVITSNDGDESTYTINVKGQVGSTTTGGGTGGGVPTVDNTINPPTNLTGVAVSTSQVNLTWEDNSANEGGFFVYQNGVLIATLTSNTTSFEVLGLDANTFYNFKIVAFNSQKKAKSNTLHIATLPNAPSVEQNIAVCGTGGVAYIQLTNAPAQGSYRWYADATGGTPLAELTQGFFETPTLTQNTTFYATTVSRNGVESSPRLAVEVFVYEAVNAEIAEGDVVKACGSEAIVNAVEQTGAVYQWKANGVLTSETGQQFVAKASGRYELIVTRNSCTDAYSFDVITDYKPTARIQNGSAVDFCGSGTLSASNLIANATYEWLLNGNVIENGSTATVSQSGTYTLRVTDNTCVNEAQILVTVYDLPQNQTITASATQFCVGDVVTLSVPALSGVSYRWFRNGIQISGAKANEFKAYQGGDYSVEMFVEDLNCNAVSQSVSISWFVSPEVELTRDDKTLNLAISIPHESVEWFTTGGIALPQFANQTSISPDFGTYWATVTYPTGCSVNSNSVRLYEQGATNGGGGVVIGIEDEEEEGSIFEVFPNPSNDGIFHIRLSTNLTTDTQLSLTDALGRDLNMNVVIPQGSTTLNLDLSEFADGMYYLQFISNEGTLSRKIIKQ
jgi:hypothetical protein